MARRPKDAPPDTARTLREIWQRLDRIEGGTLTDLHGRRMTNAGTPKERRDYANKGYIDDQIARFRSELQTEIKRTRGMAVALAGSGGSGNPGGGGAPAVDFGYYKVDTVNAPQSYFDQVKAWTNIVYLGPVDAGTSETPPSEREVRFRQSVTAAVAAGFKIMVDFELRSPNLPIPTTFAIMQPFWDSVAYIILGDELDPGTFDINAEIASLKTLITSARLPLKPIGATFLPSTVLTANVGQYDFDFINIEAYTDPCSCASGCGASTAQEEINQVKDLITQMKNLIPATRDLTVVMQAYNRNGAFADTEILAALNRATWFDMVKGDARVKALMMFAWWRENPISNCPAPNHGTFGLPELQSVHQQIWADMTAASGSGTAKKCASDPRPCPGQPVCCDGGTSNPCNCPRLCEGGSYESMVTLATQTIITAHPELFTGGILNSEGDAIAFRDFIVIRMNIDNPNLETAGDTGDGKQILVRARTAPAFREDYRVWNSSLTVAFPPGGYRATCYPGVFN